jgi:outer membrane lipopolysaccharide assembly protein LptE/RlpB
MHLREQLTTNTAILDCTLNTICGWNFTNTQDVQLMAKVVTSLAKKKSLPQL